MQVTRQKHTAKQNHSTDEEEEHAYGMMNTQDEQEEATEDKRAMQHFDSEEEFRSLPEFTLKDKYNYLKRKISNVIA